MLVITDLRFLQGSKDKLFHKEVDIKLKEISLLKYCSYSLREVPFNIMSFSSMDKL